MLPVSATALIALRTSWVMTTRVESWQGGILLTEDVPVAGGTQETDRTLQVPDRVSLTVPRLDRGVSWDPTHDPGHPLAPWGQRLRISLGVELAHGQVEWIPRGWFLIQEATPSGDTITVTAANLLALIDEARLTAPMQPTGTFVSALRRLVEPALTVDVLAAPPDRAIPASLSWDEDRLAAVMELLDAWPAAATVDASGALVVTTPTTTPGAAVLDLSSAAGGILVAAAGGASRDGAATAVVARGTDTNGVSVQATAYDTSGGPLDIAGPFNPLPVTYLFDSPLLTDLNQCTAAAETILARRRDQASRLVTVEAVPHPALLAGDPVTLDDGLGVIESLVMPLTPGDGAMRVGVRVSG
jgi:hypothetical protein